MGAEMKCPKCSYDRKTTDEAPDWQCPSCGVAYAKIIHAHENNTQQIPLIQPSTESDEEGLEEKLTLASQGQKMLIYSFLLNFLLRALEGGQVLPGTAIEVLFVCIAVYALIGIVKVCSGLGKVQDQKILFMVLSFIPFINLVMLLYLNAKTSRLLREAGLDVGLFGAKP